MTVTTQTQSRPITRSGHVVIGVDTHKHLHVAAVLDPIGGILDTLTILTEAAGYRRLLEWAASFGQIIAFGIEGTGSYGTALVSFVRRAGHKVVEVNRPDRRIRRLNGKSDTLDAENAARAVLAGYATAVPKSADGSVEMIRQLKIAHGTAVKARAAAMVTLKSVLVHASDELRREAAGKTPVMLARHLAALRPLALTTPADASRHTLRSFPTVVVPAGRDPRTGSHDRGTRTRHRPTTGGCLRRRGRHCSGDPHRGRGQSRAHPLRSGVGEAGRNQSDLGLLRDEHRPAPNQLRRAPPAQRRDLPHLIVRMRFHEPTIAYVARRTVEGKSKRDIIRCLKRYVIREVYHLIRPHPATGQIRG